MKYYLTTPIYYLNATPHIGHAYTTLVADTVKRFRRMMGDEVYLTTGTDEHGTKVERSAKDAGWEPKKYADRVAAAFQQEWDELGFEYDFFRRTSDPKHALGVQEIFTRCLKNGAIYKGSYTGKYHVSDEAFVTEEEAAQAEPDKIITITEENYFFRLSDFQERLLKLYAEDPDFVQPESRRNEVISFVKGGLKDLSISRSSLKWGIPLPDDAEHVFYVWFDALTTYMSAVGYGEQGERRQLWEKLWPADIHIIGKEILRFHAVFWPAFLMAAELPLPKRIYAHGWLIFQGGKMSKSKGNIVRAQPIDKVVGIEGLRYYLLREIVFGQDGNYSSEALIERYNADLANGLGNLASRTLSMIQRYFNGEIVRPDGEGRSRLGDMATDTIAQAVGHYEKFEFSRALEAIWSLFGAVDKFIVERKPWVLAKAEDAESRRLLCETLYDAAEVLRVGAALLYPVMPKSAAKIWGQLGLSASLEQFQLKNLAWGQLEAGVKIGAAEAIFPRLDMAPSVNRLMELEQEALEEQAKIMGKPGPEPATTEGGDKPKDAAAPAAAAESPRIGIEDFAKVELRVGQVKSAQRVEGTDKLMHLSVDIGEAEPRSIVAGIAKAYEPESLVGRKVVIVANLKPRKMRGIESNGMIVAATGDSGIPSLAGFPDDAPVGARLS
ncbi:MAG: methionine--tRNA ligase [Bryobacterales bacterium]